MLPDVTRAPAGDKGAELGVKRSVYHDLDMLRLNARRNHGIRVDIGSAEEVCLKEVGSIKECREVAEDLEDKITSRIRDAELQKQLAESNRRREAEKSDHTTIVINNNNNEVLPTPTPYYDPRYGGQYGGSVSIRHGDTEVSFGGGAHGGEPRHPHYHPTPPPPASRTPSGVREGFKPQNRFQVPYENR